jgi:hypothetical protein
MRFVWTDAGDDPTWETGDRHGIDGYFAPLFVKDQATGQLVPDPVTPAVLDEAIRRGHAHGVYFGHNWLPGVLPAVIVTRVAAEFKALAATRPKLRLMWNLEEHDKAFVLAVLEGWRTKYPTVATSWSLEGMQGGWMTQEFVQRVLACRMRVVPQSFLGDMGPVAADQVLRDLTRRGFPENIVSIFYDAAALANRWDGYAFTMGRLP